MIKKDSYYNLFGAIILTTLFLFWGPKSALAFSVGEKTNFYVDSSYDYADRANVKAILNRVSDKGLFYVEEDWWNSVEMKDEAENYIANLGAEFDQTIYPRLTQFYGLEWTPGIDNEFKITILITRMKGGAGGYFNSADEQLKSFVYSSNEREMIYLNADFFNSLRWRGYLAHEFQHLISFYQKEKLRGVKDDIWLEESRSEYALTLCGYNNTYNESNLEKRVNVFLNNPSDSLTEWRGRIDDYGPVDLFVQYLVGRYGEWILSETMKSEAAGIASLDQVLARRGKPGSFVDIFADWAVANFVNDCQLGENQQFCYANSVLNYSVFHVGPTFIRALSGIDGDFFSFKGSIEDWAPHWYKINGGGNGASLEISIGGGPETKQTFYILINYNDGIRSLKRLEVSSSENNKYLISNFGDRVLSVVLIPFSHFKSQDFSDFYPEYPLIFKTRIISNNKISNSNDVLTPTVIVPPVPVLINNTTRPSYPDGSLIRARGDAKVYVISGQYRRWIQTPQILAVYPHLGWQSVIEVTSSERDWYQESWLIRASGDTKVYEINGDGTKHWLNISGEQFSASGRNWGMIYIVNQRELSLYKIGAEIVR